MGDLVLLFSYMMLYRTVVVAESQKLVLCAHSEQARDTWIQVALSFSQFKLFAYFSSFSFRCSHRPFGFELKKPSSTRVSPGFQFFLSRCSKKVCAPLNKEGKPINSSSYRLFGKRRGSSAKSWETFQSRCRHLSCLLSRHLQVT